MQSIGAFFLYPFQVTREQQSSASPQVSYMEADRNYEFVVDCDHSPPQSFVSCISGSQNNSILFPSPTTSILSTEASQATTEIDSDSLDNMNIPADERRLVDMIRDTDVDTFFSVSKQTARFTERERQFFHSQYNDVQDRITYGDIRQLLEEFGSENAEEAFAKYKKSEIDESKSLDRKVKQWIQYDLPVLQAQNILITKESVYQVLFVINCAFMVQFGRSLSRMQIASVFVLIILKPRRRGGMLEIVNGEDKSNIVICLAIIRSLLSKSKYIDVYTFCDDLAEREVNKAHKILDVFGLTCATNRHDSSLSISKEYRTCYDANVVFGTISSFVYDGLCSEYYRQEEHDKNIRKNATAILFEDDSIFMSRPNDTVRISTPLSSCLDMELIVMKIWALVSRVTVNDTDAGQYHYPDCDDDSSLTTDALLSKIVGDVEEFLHPPADRNCTTLTASTLLRPSPYWAKRIRPVLCEYINTAIIVKFSMHPKVDYRVEGGVVIISDQCPFSDQLGVVQFLQIKNGLQRNPATLETCMMTARSWFHRYSAEYEILQRKIKRCREEEEFNKRQRQIPLVPSTLTHLELVDCRPLAENDITDVDEQAQAEIVGAYQMPVGATGHSLIIAHAVPAPEYVPTVPLEVDQDGIKETDIIESRLFGVFGSLGGAEFHSYLNNKYYTDVIRISSSTDSLSDKWSCILCPVSGHLSTVVETCLHHVQKNVPVLIIADTIALGEDIKLEWERRDPKVEVKLKIFDGRENSSSIGNDSIPSSIGTTSAAVVDSSIDEHEMLLSPKQVMIAVNLLGRDEHFRTLNAERIHVCVAFNPPHMRDLQLAVGESKCSGRVSCTCQFVTCDLEATQETEISKEEYEDRISLLEKDLVKKIKGKDVILEAQEQAFQRFCELLKQIPSIGLSERKHDFSSPLFRTIEDLWANFFCLHRNDASALLDCFDSEVTVHVRDVSDEVRMSLVQDPGLLVRLANQQKGKPAVELCERALREDPRHIPAAVQRLVHMIGTNEWKDDIPQYSQEALREACKAAKEVTESAIMRAQATQLLRSALAQDENLSTVLSSFPEEFRVENLGIVRDEGCSSGFDCTLNLQSSVRQSGRKVAPTMSDKHVAVRGVQNSKSPIPASVKPLVKCLQHLHLLEHAVLALEDVLDLQVIVHECESLSEEEWELFQEGLVGYPKPILPSYYPGREDWWRLLLTVQAACVGGLLFEAGRLGSSALYREVELPYEIADSLNTGLQPFTAVRRAVSSQSQPHAAAVTDPAVPTPLRMFSLVFGDWLFAKIATILNASCQFLRSMTPTTSAKWKDISSALNASRQRGYHDKLLSEEMDSSSPPLIPPSASFIANLSKAKMNEMLPGMAQAQRQLLQRLEVEQCRLRSTEILRAAMYTKLQDLYRQLKLALWRPELSVLVRLTVLIGTYSLPQDSTQLWRLLKRHLAMFLRGKDDATGKAPRVHWIGPLPAIGVSRPAQLRLQDMTNLCDVLSSDYCKLSIFQLIANPADVTQHPLCTALFQLAADPQFSREDFDGEMVQLFETLGFVNRSHATEGPGPRPKVGAEAGVGPGPRLWNKVLSFGFDACILLDSSPLSSLFKRLDTTEGKLRRDGMGNSSYCRSVQNAIDTIAEVSMQAVLEALQEEIDRRELRYYHSRLYN
jgi:hypothetical protein